MARKDKVIILRKEKWAIFVILLSKLSKFCVAVQYMNTWFRPNVTSCLSIVIIYWIYCNWVTDYFEEDYINAVERILYFKIISHINREDYEEYLSRNREYFRICEEKKDEK